MLLFPSDPLSQGFHLALSAVESEIPRPDSARTRRTSDVYAFFLYDFCSSP